MALLKKAQDQKEDAKGDQDSKEDSKLKKHKKHKAPPSVGEDAPQSDAGGDAQEGDDSEQPGQDSDAPPAQAGGEDSGDQGAGGQDAEDDAGAQGQPQQQPGQQQGATPVPNPQAPGAGVEEGGEDSPDAGADATGGPDQSPAGAPSAMGGPQGASMQQIPMSPALKEEYQRLDKELVTQLFQNGVAEHILPSLFPQGPHKIKAVIMTSVILARELITKNKAPIQLAMPFARDVAAHIMQLGEQVKQIQYSDQEATAIFGAVYEGIIKAFGVKKSQWQQVQSMVPRSQMGQHAKAYLAAHQHAQGAHDLNNSQPHAEHVAETQPQGPPAGSAGPQGPQGAPPAQPQGGALSQGAAASEQAQPQEQANG